MARATVTVRELKNKETGIDLSVTSYKETKGMLGSTYEYQVMVVSNLSYFKSAKHKDTDNVQFTVMKKLNEFEEIHSKFNTKYSGTAFPQLPKKVLMMNEGIAKERRNNLDQFMRYLASTPKLCTDSILLEFLGVSATKAGKLKKIVVSEKKENKGDNPDEQKDEAESEDATKENNDDNENLFDDGDDDKDDDDNDLFASNDVSADSKGDLKIFDEPDLSGALEEGEDDDLFITGSRSEVKVTTMEPSEENEENNDDLFGDDDDLDKIMKMSLKPRDNKSQDEDTNTDQLDDKDEETNAGEEAEKVITSQSKPEPPTKSVPNNEESVTSKENENTTITDFDSVTIETEKLTDSSSKEKVRPKPALRKKPDIAGKPDLKQKPGLKPKPVSSLSKPDTPTKPEIPSKPGIPNKPKIPSKPGIPSKPKIPSKPDIPTKQNSMKTDSKEGVKKSENDTSLAGDITEDDIMKYIQDNTQADDDDLDLFS